MSMWEIDTLLTNSISLIQQSDLSSQEKRNVAWSLENLPEQYHFDAGGFTKTENDDNGSYQEVTPFQLGAIVAEVAAEQNQINHIYDWSAFLLNFYGEYFALNDSCEALKKSELNSLKQHYHRYDFSNYKPIHATLTVYENGNDYFSDEQNDLIRWFLN